MRCVTALASPMFDSDDDMPLAQRAHKPAAEQSDEEDDRPLAHRQFTHKPTANGNGIAAATIGTTISTAVPASRSATATAADLNGWDSSSSDDIPLAQRKKELVAQKSQATQPKGQKAKPVAKDIANREGKRKRQNDVPKGRQAPSKKTKTSDDAPPRKKRVTNPASQGAKEEDKEIKWEKLRHAGVLFPPEYVRLPSNVRMLYDGQPVDLTEEQEEVAQMFAIMKETDYMKKQLFLDNFWNDFKKVLGKDHVIKGLKKCDFTPMYDHAMAEREKKKALSKEEKLAIKEKKEADEAKFKYAQVDGRTEQVGNFRVEPPGLFRGRGEHPRMGKLKSRIYPRDIVINIGMEEPVPEHPYPGQQWKEVRHDKTVTWLAYWKEPIAQKDFKYVWLAANSTFKSDSDLAKYEKARKLKNHVDDIRKMYEKDWDSKDTQRQQMGCALYFIDQLALRAGHEKDEDEADTVGCCTLKVENVECMPGDHIKFDFLGKDSIRYENEVVVHPKVYALIQKFCHHSANNKPKKPEDQLFETMDATDLNKTLKDLMDGLSVKVFRTYNASITLDRLLWEPSDSEVIDAKKADYDRANKEVAILCNHQRAVPKGHAGQMEKLSERMHKLNEELLELQHELKASEKGKAYGDKKRRDPERVHTAIDAKKAVIAKAEINASVKDDLKTVALGTSKINYLDPRITVAWCKRNEVPMEKIFNKTLITKFFWAMDVDPDFKF